MGKADQTRKKIILHAAELFNVQGYNGTAISDVMKSTGLKKGGIYAHFNSKEDLAVAAFDYAYKRISKLYAEIFAEFEGDPVAQLIGTIEVYRDMDSHAPIKGGCPLLNTAIESDDYHPVLKQRAQEMMRQWQNFIKRLVRDGIEAQVIHETVDGDALATMIISTIEGGLMMSKLMDKPDYLRQMIDNLITHIESNVAI